MKKLLLFLILLFPFVVGAQTNCVCDSYQLSDTSTVAAENSMHFDGFNDRQIQFGDVTFYDSGPSTTRIVFRKLTNSQTLNRVVWSKWANTSNQRSIELLITTANKLMVRVSSNGTAVVSATGGTTVNDPNIFYDVVVEFDPTGSTNSDKIKLWINKAQETLSFSGTVSSTIYNSNSYYRIGLEGAGTTFDQLNAYVNHFTVTSDLLTQTEIDSVYNNGKPLMTSTVCNNIVLYPLIDSATYNTSTDVWTIPDWASNYTGTTVNMFEKERVPKNPYWDKRYLAILHAGQSNSGTFTSNTGLSSVYKESRFDVRTWQGTNFPILSTTTSTFPTINGGTHGDQFSLGWDLADKLPHDILFINYSVGGTSMYDYWKYGASLYNDMTKTMDSVICYMEANNMKYDMFIDFNQGEHDSQDATKSAAYSVLYPVFIDSLRSHYPCLKGYIVTMTRSNLGAGFSYAPVTHQAEDTTITLIGRSDFMKVDVDDLEPGSLHIGAGSQQTQGRRKSPYYLSQY